MPNNRRAATLINLVTGSRVAFAVAVAALTPWSRLQGWAIWASAALVAAIEVTDLVDGYLARRHNAVSEFGKMFDPYSDSISRLTVFWALAVVGRCWLVTPLVMAVRDVTVTYSRIIMTRRGIDVSARHTGKLKALVQGAAGLALTAGPLYWGAWGGAVVGVLSAAVILITLASMVDYGLAAVRSS